VDKTITFQADDKLERSIEEANSPLQIIGGLHADGSNIAFQRTR
jgi:hypothetical protein